MLELKVLLNDLVVLVSEVPGGEADLLFYVVGGISHNCAVEVIDLADAAVLNLLQLLLEYCLNFHFSLLAQANHAVEYLSEVCVAGLIADLLYLVLLYALDLKVARFLAQSFTQQLRNAHHIELQLTRDTERF